MYQRAPATTWQTVERRIGRCGRRAHLVTFLHSTKRMSEVYGTDADGSEYPLMSIGPRASLRRERVSLNYLDGRRCVEFGERAEFRPWAARPVLDASGHMLAALRVNAASVWFRTHWTVEDAAGSTVFTIVEPLRDGLIRRFVRGPLKCFALGSDTADDYFAALLLPLLMPIVFAPLLLIKRRGRLMIHDGGQRIGLIEYRTLQMEPRTDFTVHIDVDVVTSTDARLLVAATMGPMIACWA